MLLGHCNIWGSGTLYGERIYTEPCYIFDSFDFGVSLFDFDTDQPINNISWELYRRDDLLDPDGLVDESHILVGSGTTTNSLVRISLSDYGLRYLSTDYYLKSWKTNDHNYVGRLRIKYLAEEYTSKDDNWPYIRDALQVKKKEESVGGSGGMGGDVVTHTEYRDKPMPVIKVMAITDEEELEDKEIWIVNIKDFDNI